MRLHLATVLLCTGACVLSPRDRYACRAQADCLAQPGTMCDLAIATCVPAGSIAPAPGSSAGSRSSSAALSSSAPVPSSSASLATSSSASASSAQSLDAGTPDAHSPDAAVPDAAGPPDAGCVHLSGDFTITGDGALPPEMDGVPCFSLTGTLLVTGVTASGVTVNALGELTGTLTAYDNPALTYLRFQGLQSVQPGGLVIQANPELVGMILPELRTAAGRFELSNNPKLSAVDLPYLALGADTDVIVDANALLNEFLVPSTVSTLGSVVLSDVPVLRQVDFTGVPAIAGDLTIYAPLLDLTAFAGLTTVGGNFRLATGSFDTVSLRGLHRLTNVGGAVIIDGNLGLVSLGGLERLASAARLEVKNNLFLPECDAQLLLEQLGSPAGSEIGLNDVSKTTYVVPGGAITVTPDAGMPPELASAGCVRGDVTFDSVLAGFENPESSLDAVTMQGNLTHLNVTTGIARHGLRSLRGTLRVEGSTGIWSGFPDLGFVDGLVVRNNPALRDCEVRDFYAQQVLPAGVDGPIEIHGNLHDGPCADTYSCAADSECPGQPWPLTQRCETTADGGCCSLGCRSLADCPLDPLGQMCGGDRQCAP